MKAFCVLGALVSSAFAAISDVQCRRHVEIVMVQDATTSYATFGDNMGPQITKLMSSINERMGDAVASVALFCDKPTPFRGAGEGRGYLGVIDVCYSNDATKPLTADASVVAQGYDAIYDLECTGGDYPEGSLEALMYAAQDPKIGWSSADKVYTDDRKRIVKVAVLITDDHPHYAGDVLSGILAWNPLPAGQSDGYSRFFDADFINKNGFYSQPDTRSNYARIVELHQQASMTAAEQAEYDRLLEIMGPAVYDYPEEHPGTFEVYKNCKKYEYPTLKVIGDVLNREKVLPVVILSGQSITNTGIGLCAQRGFTGVTRNDPTKWLECLKAIYTSDLESAGIENFIVSTYNDAADLVSEITDRVDALSRDISCPETTTTDADFNDSTTVESTEATEATDSTEVTESETTPAEIDGNTTGASDASTDAEHASSEATDAGDASTEASSATDGADTTEANGGDDTTAANGGDDTTAANGGDDTSAANGGDDTTEITESEYISGTVVIHSSTTEHIVPPVAPVPGHSSNTAVVAGASGGAAAGAAALGGLLYKKFGASLLGHNTPGDLNVGEQVETPETPVEREAFEEVTTDMFQ